jgi:CRP-like cAMP-binding protein
MLSTIRLVVQGYIELISHDIDGRASPLTQLGPGQWATLLGAFDEQPPISDFFSSPQAVYIALPAAALRQTADAHPAFYRAIIHYMGYRLRLLMEWTTRGSQLKHSRKMAALLATTARLNPLQGDSAILNFTQEKLASLTHCSRQSAQGHLAELVALGLIENGYRQIRIPSLQTLEAYAYRDGG